MLIMIDHPDSIDTALFAKVAMSSLAPEHEAEQIVLGRPESGKSYRSEFSYWELALRPDPSLFLQPSS
jgi:hypothetical protein